MCRWWWLSVVIMRSSSLALAQEEPTPQQLQRMYNDALVQLKAAQARKNELNSDNEKLTQKVAELQKQLDDLRHDADQQAEKTYTLRAHYAAWEQFVRIHPQLMTQWRCFLENSLVALPEEMLSVPADGQPAALGR